jgi:hypothetical protein
MSSTDKELISELERMRAQLQSAEERLSVLTSAFQTTPLKIELQEKESPQKEDSTFSSIIKDEILLIGLFVLFIGIIHTETYYSAFGVRYQFLELPTFHVIYRGLTAIIAAPYLLIPYVLAIGWLGFERYITSEKRPRLLRFRRLVSFFVIFILLVITYPLARLAGQREAKSDLYVETSALPQILNLELSGDVVYGPEAGYRLLVVDSDYLVVFKPLKQSDISAAPIIKRFSKGGVNVIETDR